MLGPRESSPGTEAELRKLRSRNAVTARGKYLDDVNLFRASTLLKLQEVGLTVRRAGNVSWMYFNIPLPNSGSDVGPSVADMVVMCALIASPWDNKEIKTIPKIRILRSEAYDTQLATEYLTTDVCVDDEGDSQYFVDSIRARDSDRPQFPPANDAELKNSEVLAKSKSHVPFFYVKDGDLVLLGTKLGPSGFPAQFEWTDQVDGRVHTINPFGRYTILTHACDALSVATSCLEEVKDLEPEHTGQI